MRYSPLGDGALWRVHVAHGLLRAVPGGNQLPYATVDILPAVRAAALVWGSSRRKQRYWPRGVCRLIPWRSSYAVASRSTASESKAHWLQMMPYRELTNEQHAQEYLFWQLIRLTSPLGASTVLLTQPLFRLRVCNAELGHRVGGEARWRAFRSTARSWEALGWLVRS